jgi:phytoene synthase
MPSAADLRALRRHARTTAPDVFFASHFAPRDRRADLYTLSAVVRQLSDVIVPATVAAPAGLEATGCSTCGEETPEQRRAVAHSVMDFLFSGDKTGKPELDAFTDMAARRDIQRADFNPLIEGLSLHATLRRYATWKRLRDVCDQTAGSVGLMTWRILGGPAPDATTRDQIVAFATACRLAVVLNTLGEQLAANRLMVPLDDLVKFSIIETQVRSFAAAQTTAGDPRWVELMRFEIDRVRKLYQGGSGALAALDSASRLAAAVYGETHLALLDKLAERGFDPFKGPVRSGWWDRLRRLPSAVAVAGRLSDKSAKPRAASDQAG